MTTPNDQPQSPEAPKRSGCGARGCLFGCLTPIVVIGISFVFALPTLSDKWSAFQAENPWVAQVPGVAAVFKDVVASRDTNNDGAAADSTGPGRRSAKRLEGSDDKEAMPKDLPLWPKARSEAYSAGEGHAAAYQEVHQTSDSVLQFFRRAMPARGWRLDKEQIGAGGTLLLYQKSNRIARVEVVADSAGTDVWLRSRTISPSARP